MLPARTRDDNVRATGTRTQKCFHVPGHSHPVGGGLPHCTPGHHPAGRILAGKTGGLRGLEGRGAGPGEWEAVLGTRCAPVGHSEPPSWRSPESGQVVWPLRPHRGWGVLGSKLCSCCRHLRQKKPSKNQTGPALPLPIRTNQKPQVEKGDFLFSFQKGLLK